MLFCVVMIILFGAVLCLFFKKGPLEAAYCFWFSCCYVATQWVCNDCAMPFDVIVCPLVDVHFSGLSHF